MFSSLHNSFIGSNVMPIEPILNYEYIMLPDIFRSFIAQVYIYIYIYFDLYGLAHVSKLYTCSPVI